MTSSSRTARKAYYSARTGDVDAVRIDLDAARSLFLSVYKRFVEGSYFEQAFGGECVDLGFTPGFVGEDIEAFFFRKIRKRHLWPIFEKYDNYSEPDLLSVIELLYDVISKPDQETADYHSWNDCGWHFKDFDKAAGQLEFRSAINEFLYDYGEGFRLSEDGQVLPAKRPPTQTPLTAQPLVSSTFDSLFTFGLPIGLSAKPSGAVEFSAQGQTFNFDETDFVGVLRGEVYPNFCMADLSQWATPRDRLGKYANPVVPLRTPLGLVRAECLTILHNLCQTTSEKDFLKAYLEAFVAPYARSGSRPGLVSLDFLAMKDTIPALLPQAWVNWRSNDRDALKRMGYRYANTTMRFDFVLFWQSRNFLVQVDDIEHYAEKVDGRWDANEERYAARLKEDRLLRMQGWHIFRLSNWETRDRDRLKAVLRELRLFVGFERPVSPAGEKSRGDIES